MLEQYVYSIPRKKKIYLGILITLLVLTLLSKRVYSGPFTWIASTVTDNITDEIFEGLNQSIGGAVGSILDWVMNIFTEPFGPSLDTFIDKTTFAGISAATFINGFAVSTGLFISTIIWGFSMFAYFFTGKVTDSRDTPISLTIRYGISIAVCFSHKIIIDTFIGLIDDIYSAYAKTAITQTLQEAGAVSIAESIGDNVAETTLLMFGSHLAFANLPGVKLIILVIQVVFIFLLLKAFFQLYMEMLSRYIVSCVLLCLFSTFGATIVSNNTNQIFKSYLRTLFSSFLVMLFNILWFKMCFFVMLTSGSLLANLLSYFFLLELLHFGTKFDGMLRSMGLGVATGGSRIASAIGGAGRNLANTLRNVDSARKAAGGLLTATGVRTGNKNLHDVGKVIGASSKDIANGNVTQDPRSFAQSLGAAGRKIADSEVSGPQAAGMIAKHLASPKNTEFENAVSALSNNKLKEGAQALMGESSGYKVDSARLGTYKTADGSWKTGVIVSGTYGSSTDKDGNIIPGKQFSGVIGQTGDFNTATPLGEDKGFAFYSDKQLNNGQTCDLADATNFAGPDAAKAIEDARANDYKFPEGAYLEKDGFDSNRQDVFNVRDANHNQLGTIAGDQFMASAEDLKATEKANAFAEMQSHIMGGVCEDGKWGNYKITKGEDGKEASSHFVAGEGIRYADITPFEPVQGRAGVYRATATDDDGRKYDFTATDKGIYAESRTNNEVGSFMYTNDSPSLNATFGYDVNQGKMYIPEERGNTASETFFGKSDGSDNNDSDDNGPGGDGGSRGSNGSGKSLGAPDTQTESNTTKERVIEVDDVTRGMPNAGFEDVGLSKEPLWDGNPKHDFNESYKYKNKADEEANLNEKIDKQFNLKPRNNNRKQNKR